MMESYAIASMNVKTYPRTGSLLGPYPLANHSIFGYSLSLHKAFK